MGKPARMSAAERQWADRVLVTLDDLGSPVDDRALLQALALRFADRFGPKDRAYLGSAMAWHGSVTDALADLIADGQVEGTQTRELTAAGTSAVAGARKRIRATPAAATRPGDAASADQAPVASGPNVLAGVISTPLRGLAEGPSGGEPQPVMIELNLKYGAGPAAARAALTDLWAKVTDGRPLVLLSDNYAAGRLSGDELTRLVSADAAGGGWAHRSIYHVWPDFEVHKQVDGSAVTVKADAARRTFNADGRGIAWAVIDSGIDATHPHFRSYGTLTDTSVKDLHRSFLDDLPTEPGAAPDDPLVDLDGHGTHVAGIIAGGLERWEGADSSIVVTQARYNVASPLEPIQQPRFIENARVALAGMAPRANLVSLKVLGGGGDLTSRVSRVMRALAYVREVNSGSDSVLRIHGVNLSLGYDFDASWFACGSSPLCKEIDRLVHSGVIVVVAAGNSGYGTLNVERSEVNRFGLPMTINDPGNAEKAITVGSTHRTSPHTFGVSYFSSKGPTGDGRQKPDLVAPGERISSAAAGARRAAVSVPQDVSDPAVYVEDTGTSMAAPHVSGAAAAFLSVRQEFIGKPDDVKRVLLDSAMPLGRERAFEGAGLVDLIRALQSV